MSDLNDLIKRFSAGSGSTAKPGSAQSQTPPPVTEPAAKPISKPIAPKASAKPTPKKEAGDEVMDTPWELPRDIRPSHEPSVIPTPSRDEPSEVITPPEEVIPAPQQTQKPPQRTPARKPEREEPRWTPSRKPRREEPRPAYATVETAGTRPAVKPPLRGGHVGRVLNLQEIPKDELPPRMTRWFTSLLTGVPYTPSKTGVIFYLQPEDEDEAGRVYRVTAYGNLGLTNHMRLCVQGHSESTGNLVAHRIERDASVDPAHPDWTPVRDRRSRSTLSLWLTIIGVVLLGWLLLSELLMPLIGWLTVFGGEMLSWVVVIVILIAIFGGFGRGRGRLF